MIKRPVLTTALLGLWLVSAQSNNHLEQAILNPILNIEQHESRASNDFCICSASLFSKGVL
jgi:hypothetical protein